jgi:hypothetical protein
MHAAVYPTPSYVESLATSTPVSDHVAVDAELRGCPIDPGQLLEVLTALSIGRRPQLPDEAVCAECKRRGIVCVVVAKGLPCLGPLTATGCGALCPAFARGCYACFGPRESANVESLAGWFEGEGRDRRDMAGLLSGFTAWAPALRRAIDARGGPTSPAGPAAGARSDAPPPEAHDARD